MTWIALRETKTYHEKLPYSANGGQFGHIIRTDDPTYSANNVANRTSLLPTTFRKCLDCTNHSLTRSVTVYEVDFASPCVDIVLGNCFTAKHECHEKWEVSGRRSANAEGVRAAQFIS